MTAQQHSLALPLRIVETTDPNEVMLVEHLNDRIVCFCDEYDSIQLIRSVNTFYELLEACKSARKVISEIADIDSQCRAGWAHKALEEAIQKAEAEI
jgi:hypothetical protein